MLTHYLTKAKQGDYNIPEYTKLKKIENDEKLLSIWENLINSVVGCVKRLIDVEKVCLNCYNLLTFLII